MEAVGVSGYALSRALDTSEAVISNIRTGKNPPNIQLVELLLKKYEALNATWLLTGRGNMFHETLSSASPPTIRAVDAEERLNRIERLLERSLVVQVERNLLADEAHLELEKHVVRLEKELTALKKERHKSV
jgi:hypothetical protein